MSLFRKATKTTAKLRMGLVGPSGAGKTWSALAIATELAAPHGRIAVIDTEHGSASLYSSHFPFDVLELAAYDPRNYIDAIAAAESEGYAVLVIDSLSHAWSGKGGALEMVDSAAKRSRSNNTYTAWRDVTPLHNALIDAMIACRCHLIATMRSKVEYALEADQGTGKLSPKKIGMAPIQREGMDYEFTIVGDLDLDHNLVISKTRCDLLDQEVIRKPGAQLARRLKAWLSDGASDGTSAPPPTPPLATQQGGGSSGAAPPETTPPAVGGLTADMTVELRRLFEVTRMTGHQIRSALARRGVASVERLAINDAQDLIYRLTSIASREEFERSLSTDGSTVAEHQAEIAARAAREGAGGAATEGEVPADPDSASDPAADAFTIPEVPRRDKSDKPGEPAEAVAATEQPTPLFANAHSN